MAVRAGAGAGEAAAGGDRRRLAGPAADVEAVQGEALEDALGKRRGNVALPHALAARVGQLAVRITAGVAGGGGGGGGGAPGGGWGGAEIVAPPPVQPRGRRRLEALLDADAAGEPLVVRSRRAGDRLRPLGLGGGEKPEAMLGGGGGAGGGGGGGARGRAP